MGFERINYSRNKKAQVTIFIILAVVIVVGIVFYFVLISQRDTRVEEMTLDNPKQFVVSCVQETLNPTIRNVMENGGRMNSTNFINYNGSKYNYLCYNGDFYASCYNTHPMLEAIVENEIRESTTGAVVKCFDDLRVELESKGYSVDGGKTGYMIDLLPGKVSVILRKSVEISKDGNSKKFVDFNFEILSPIYDLVRVSREIVNSEAQYCNVEIGGYMILYPQYNIRRINYMDSKLYFVGDRKTGQEFKFAIRGCALPPGI